MPLIKIKVKVGTANKIINVERTLPNIYEVFEGEVKKKYPEYPFNIFYKFKETTIQVIDNATLLQSIDDCIKNKQAFLQLEGEKKEEPKPEPKKEEIKKEEPKQEVKKEEPKKEEIKKEEPKKVEQPKQEVKKEEPKKEEKKPEIKKEEPKKEEEIKKPKFCSNCGAKLEGGKFCSECGAPTGASPAPQTQQKQEEKKEEPKPQHRPTTPPKDVLEDDEMKCPKCQKPVGAGVKALGHFWHSECFTCSVCDQKFGGERRLMEHNGKPICSICYDETCTARCFKCGKPLIGKYLVIDGHNYHQNCFVCSRCGKPFTGSYMLIGGQPVCKKCV